MIGSDTRALLAACRACPDDDTPRLLLADAIQEDGFDGGAQYIRDSIEHAVEHKPMPRRRKAMGADYIRWLRALLEVPPDDTGGSGVCAAESWDAFNWRVAERRYCTLNIDRGLPYRLMATAPLLMERASALFAFPLMECCVGDRRPERCPVFGVYEWMRVDYPQTWNTWEEEPRQIPKPLYDHLEYALVRSDKPRREWALAQFAVAALNKAALSFGRAAMGSKSMAV